MGSVVGGIHGSVKDSAKDFGLETLDCMMVAGLAEPHNSTSHFQVGLRMNLYIDSGEEVLKILVVDKAGRISFLGQFFLVSYLGTM